MEIVGKIVEKLTDLKGVNAAGRPWHIQEWLVEVPQFSELKKIPVKFSGVDRLERLQIKVSDKLVKVFFDLSSREFNSRFYVELNGYDVREVDGAATSKPRTIERKSETQKLDEVLKIAVNELKPEESNEPIQELPF